MIQRPKLLNGSDVPDAPSGRDPGASTELLLAPHPSLRNEVLRKQLHELAEQRPRFGSPRLHALLRREGYVVNHKRTERIYREEGLTLKRRRRRRLVRRGSGPRDGPRRINQRWSLDFVSNAASNGQTIRVPTVVDDYTRECLATEVDTSLPVCEWCGHWIALWASGAGRRESF
jgi:transposase InsO family protein